jgi:2-dehydro-3-deoxygluconokinase
MALLDPVGDGPLELERTLTLRVAGAESNFGIALVRLGVPVTWISRLGTDPFGDVVYRTLADEDLDLSYVTRDSAAPTGLFCKWREGGRSRVVYYRKGSAASLLGEGDVPRAALEGVSLVHLTGITMALSESARGLVLELAARARERRITVLFDPNYRPPLWPGPERCAAVQRDVLPFVDWYLCGLEEGGLLFGSDTAEELLGALHDAGINGVPPPRLCEVRDEVGAGDGFAAGFAYGLLRGWAPTDCARAGNLIAGCALGGTGDWETFPRLAEVEKELQPTGGGVA